jgi:glucose uptake protein
MLLPTTATAVWVALIVSLICWGSWPVLFKRATKARFEFFAYDFAWGALLASVLAAYTLGSWNTHDLTFQDNFLIVGVRKEMVAFACGAIFGIANVMLLGSVAVAGMSVAFPIAYGIAWAALALWNMIGEPTVNPLLSIGGAAVALFAVILAIIALSWYLKSQQPAPPPGESRKTVSQTGRIVKASVLGIFAGVFLTFFFILLSRATVGDLGLAPYSAAVVIGPSVVFISFLIVPFFLSFPVRGQALPVSHYFRIEKRHHLLGIAAGIVWIAGLLAGLMADNLPAEISSSPIASFIVTHSVPLLAVLWGLFVWREMSGAPTRVLMMMLAMFVMLSLSIGMISLAPVYGH